MWIGLVTKLNDDLTKYQINDYLTREDERYEQFYIDVNWVQKKEMVWFHELIIRKNSITIT